MQRASKDSVYCFSVCYLAYNYYKSWVLGAVRFRAHHPEHDQSLSGPRSYTTAPGYLILEVLIVLERRHSLFPLFHLLLQFFVFSAVSLRS